MPAPTDSPSQSNPPEKNSSRVGAGFLWGLFIMLALVIVVPLVLAVTGIVNVSAQKSFGPIDSGNPFPQSRS